MSKRVFDFWFYRVVEGMEDKDGGFKAKAKMQKINHTDVPCLLKYHVHAHQHPFRPINPNKPTHVIDPYKTPDTQTPSDVELYNNKCLYNREIKFRVHLAI